MVSSSSPTLQHQRSDLLTDGPSRENPLPLDWPPLGTQPIDLVVHDPPHASSLTEWWYTNAHLTLADGRELALFVAFFRIVVGRDPTTLAPTYAHSVTWGLSDLSRRRFIFDTLVDRKAAQIGLDRLTRMESTKRGMGRDPRVRRALREMLERDQVPYPDHKFENPPFCATGKLDLDFDGNRFVKTDAGNYRLSLWHQHHKAGVELEFAPGKSAVRHGDDGVVRGPDGADMFYYFIPRLVVTGDVTIDGVRLPVARGEGWYDHEFGGHKPRETKTEGAVGLEDVAWNWCALQLDDGSEISAYTITDLVTGKPMAQKALRVDSAGQRHDVGAFVFEPVKDWRSTRTFNTYPVLWQLRVPSLELACEVAATFPDQEIVTLISKPAFWEGRCEVVGTIGGQALRGRGYIERSGYLAFDDLENFFRAVGVEVRRSVAQLLPYEPTYEQVRGLVASEARDHYMEGVDLAEFVKTGVAPVREITDRGGKGWRSYAALACCDVVGGDSREYVQWLAMPELMHVGSLIVDDVQDRSTVRRGGPACHVTHGDALAINAGTSCYFMGQSLLHGTNVSNTQKLQLYDLYFEALRAGHAGQAADIKGLAGYMPRAVETGDTRELLSRVLAIHRLKTAAPAGALARMGTLVGGGSAAQIEGLGRYFESLGLAFQMVDDVLNLRGFAGELKLRGEDISHGKVTLPAVHALGKLELSERQWLWEAIAKKPQEQAEIDPIIALIERGEGLTRTAQEAADLVESAWRAVDPLLEPSVVKLMLRAFGWFVLQRHY